MQKKVISKSAAVNRPKKTLPLSMAAYAVAGLLMAQASPQARAADPTATVKNGSTDLTMPASYNFSTGTAIGNTYDIIFASGTAYSPSAFNINANLNPATLNDLSGTPITIDNTSTTLATTLTLPGGTNSLAPFTADTIFVATGSTLSIGTASPTKPLTLVFANNINIDNAGTLNIGAAINISSGKVLNLIGAGTTTFTGPIAPATGTASLVQGGPGTLIDNVANGFAKMSNLTITGGGTVSTTAAQTTLPTAISIGGGGTYSEVNAGVSTTDAFGVFTLNNGSGTVSIAGNSGVITVFSATKFNRSAGATALIRGTNLGQGTTGAGQFTLGDGGASLGTLVGSSTINAGAVTGTATSLQIVPFLLGDASATGSGSNFVTYDTANGLRVLDAASQDTTLSAGYTTAGSPENVIGFNGTVATSGLTVNSLLFNATGQTLAGSGGLTVNSGAIAVVGASGTSDTIDSSFGTLTLGNGEGVLTATTGNTLTINVPIAVTNSGGVTKAGAGTLVLNASNSYTGNTTINGGTLVIGNGNALPASTSVIFGNASTLNLGSFSPTITNLTAASNSTASSTISVATGNTLTVTNNLTVGLDLSPSAAAVNTNLTISGAGTLSVTGNLVVGQAQNQSVSVGANFATLDLTSLSSVVLGSTSNPGNNVVEVGYGGQNSGVLKLSNSANSITALGVLVGDTNGASGIGPVPDALILGNGTNVIDAATIAIGSGVSGTNLANVTNKASGLVEFASQAPGGAGTLTVANEVGSPGITIDIAYRGNSPGSGVSESGTLDLRGHSINITGAGTINIANEVNTGAGGSTGILAFDTGSISATTINLGALSAGSGAAASTGNLNMGGGTLTVGTLNLGLKTGAGTGLASGIVNVTGGTLTVTNGFTVGSRATGGTSAATLAITGGTVSSNVSILQGTTASTTGTVTLSGGTLNLNGNTLGSAIPITNLNFQSGTLENVSEINSGGAIAKTTAGTLTITGTNTYTGTTNVTAGTVLVGNTNAVQNSTVNISGGSVNFAGGLGSANFGSLAGTGNLALTDTAGVPVALFVGSNNAKTAYSGNLTGVGGSLTKNGTGLLTLSGVSSYTGATTINTGGALLSGNLGATAVTVNGGTFLTGTGNGTNGVIGGGVTLASNAAIDFSKDGATGTAQKLSVGSLSLGSGSNLTYNLVSAGVSDTVASSGSLNLTPGGQDFINLGGTFTPGTYTLLTYANQTGIAPVGTYVNGTANEPFIIGNTTFAGSINYTFNDTSTALTLQIAVAASPVDYFYGAYARSQGGNGTTGTFGGTNGSLTNFAANAAGTNDAGQVPGTNADVVFSANQSGTGGPSLVNANISATLDTSYTINSLTVNSTPASTTIGGNGNLTLTAGIDSFYLSGGVGILVSPGAGPLTINTTGQLIAGGNETWNNASGHLFTVTSGVAGPAISGVTSLTLSNSNTGNTALSGTIADGGNGGQLALIISNTGAGVTILSGNNTYTGGTTINSGTLQVGSATALSLIIAGPGSGAVNPRSIQHQRKNGRGATLPTESTACPLHRSFLCFPPFLTNCSAALAQLSPIGSLQR